MIALPFQLNSDVRLRAAFEEVRVAEFVEALTGVAQVRSGKRRGWRSREVAWRKTLKGPSSARA